MHIIWQLIFFVTLLDVKLNFCLNHRTPSHLSSMEGTRERPRCLCLNSVYALSISPSISIRDPHFFHLDGWISLEQCNLQLIVRDTNEHSEQEPVQFLALQRACRTGWRTLSLWPPAGQSPPSFVPPARAVHSRSYTAPSTRPCTAPSTRRPQPLHAPAAATAAGRALPRASCRRRCSPLPLPPRAAGAAAGGALA